MTVWVVLLMLVYIDEESWHRIWRDFGGGQLQRQPMKVVPEKGEEIVPFS